MMSDNVSWTNDDAACAKLSAVKLNYWTDNHINEFVSSHASSRRRTPEINRGYWARVTAFDRTVKQFLDLCGERSQIINLGAGFDTMFWRLSEQKIKFSCIVDVDLSQVTSYKVRSICKSEKLLSYLKEVNHSETELHSLKYHLIDADLRRGQSLVNKLKKECSIDPKCPTLFIAECVFVYLSINESDSLLTSLSSVFSRAACVLYEPIQVRDPFMEVMKDNLRARNCELSGICSIEEQEERFTRNGWTSARVFDMRLVYEDFFDRNEVSRIEKIEFLDERELLSQLLSHYCFVIAVTHSELTQLLNWN